MPGSVEVGPQAFDAQDLFSCFTLDTASEFLFGKVRSTLDKPMENQRNSAGPNDKNRLDEDRFAAFVQALQVGLLQIFLFFSLLFTTGAP